MMPEEVEKHIQNLRQYDNTKGYKKEYDDVKKVLQPTINALVQMGEDSLEQLHSLLEQEETWSCLFALEALREIKSRKSIAPLIRFITRNEDGDYFESCDEALQGLVAIGAPSIEPLLAEIQESFGKKEYFGYLVGALTGIKHDGVYAFMEDTLKKYMGDVGRYDDWFEIDNFVSDFDVQGNKEILPLLKKLACMDHLSETERREIRSTIQVMEDPEGFSKEIEEFSKKFKDIEQAKIEEVNERELLEQAIEFESKKDYEGALECLDTILTAIPKSYHALFIESRIYRKLGKPQIMVIGEALKLAKKNEASRDVLDVMEEERQKIADLYHQNQSTADEDFELNFNCALCGKRQNLKPGLIWRIEGSDQLCFENEMMCRHCQSHDVKMTKFGEMELWGHSMRMVSGDAGGIVDIHNKVGVLNKMLPFSRAHAYLESAVRKSPLNGELHLRLANSARKRNMHESALYHYKKAIELNPKLIAAYVNLIEIFGYRYSYYHLPKAKEDALFYLEQAKELHGARDYDCATLNNPKDIIYLLREKGIELGSPFFLQKIAEEDVHKVFQEASAIDVHRASQSIKSNIKKSKEEGERLLREHRGVMVLQSYNAFDNKTKEYQRMSVSSVLEVEPSKRCICGSGKPLKECCFTHVKYRRPFVANLDYDTYSLYDPKEVKIDIPKGFPEAVKLFKEDRRFFCTDETWKRAFFVFYGTSIFSDKELGAVVFGTLEVKKGVFGSTIIEVGTLSTNRMEALLHAVKENIGEEEASSKLGKIGSIW